MSEKSPELDGLPAEVFRCTVAIFCCQNWVILLENVGFKKRSHANIIHLYKTKGDKSDCEIIEGYPCRQWLHGKIMARPACLH